MNQFWKWFARGLLRERFSTLWLWAFACAVMSFTYVGWWAVLWLIIAAVPISFLEVWWNEYADDYDDLEEGDGE